ncbi:MAG: hypothetical protein Q6K99_03500 [Thermostichales cyanobacterium BF4_bins_65]
MALPTIQNIVQQAFSARELTTEQEDLIHQLLQKQQYTSADLDALEKLTDHLLSGKIVVRRYQAA